MPKKMSNKRSPKSDDSGSDSDTDEEVEIIDQKEYRKFLNALFPSKYMKKLKKMKRLKKM